MNGKRTPLYCPFCGSASFTVSTDNHGAIEWIMCLACGWDSNVYGGDISKWGGGIDIICPVLVERD